MLRTQVLALMVSLSHVLSQADANAKALAAVTAQGQSVANSKGTCTWTGSYTGQVQKNNCADGGVGDMVSVK